MDDYQINKRLAEIAGLNVIEDTSECEPLEDYEDPNGILCGVAWEEIVWSPLTDWSQLGPLMEQFDVAVKRRVGGTSSHDGHWAAEVDGLFGVDLDMKRAICLAIIAAHEDD
jgi:hypothetical protein